MMSNNNIISTNNNNIFNGNNSFNDEFQDNSTLSKSTSQFDSSNIYKLSKEYDEYENNSDDSEDVNHNSNTNSDNYHSVNDPNEEKLIRNRTHAKNTRMRKKNYIESLKESIKTLSDEMERIDNERKAQLSNLAEQTSIRKKVLQTMFYFRATAEASRKSWENVLEESFTLSLPITPYRSFPPAEVIDGQRIVKGIDAVIADSASLYVMLQSIVSPIDDDGKIAIQFISGPDESIMSDNTFMCKWQMTTTNAIDRGCRCEVSKSGMLKALFSNNNKLLLMEQTFDVMNFMQQLRRSSGNYDFFVIPNTPLLAEEDVGEARMIIEASSTLKITYVNQMWRSIFGWNDSSKYLGKHGISSICGEDSDPNKLSEITAAMSRGLPYSTVMTCYAEGRKAFRGWVRMYPLYSGGIVTHFLCVCENLGDSEIRKDFRITSGNLAANSILIRNAAVAAATAAGQDAGKAAEADSMRNHAPSNHSSSDGGMASTISSKSFMNGHSMYLTNGSNTLDNMSGGGSVAGFSLDSSLPFIRSSYEANSLRNSGSTGSNGSGGERDSDSIPSNPSTSKTNDSSEARPDPTGHHHGQHHSMNVDSSNNKMSASSADASKDSNSAPVAVGSETNSSEGRTTKAADSSNDGSSGGKIDSNGEPNGSLSGSNSSDNVSDEKRLTSNDANNPRKKHFLNEGEQDKMNYEPYTKKRRVQSSEVNKDQNSLDEDDSFDENLLSY